MQHVRIRVRIRMPVSPDAQGVPRIDSPGPVLWYKSAFDPESPKPGRSVDGSQVQHSQHASIKRRSLSTSEQAPASGDCSRILCRS